MASSAIIAAPALAREGSLMKIAVPKEGIIKPKLGEDWVAEFQKQDKYYCESDIGNTKFNPEIDFTGVTVEQHDSEIVTSITDCEGEVFTVNEGDGKVLTVPFGGNVICAAPQLTCKHNGDGTITISDGFTTADICTHPVKTVTLDEHLALQQRLESLETALGIKS